MRGRKPIPLAIRRLTGIRSRRPMLPEPMPLRLIPECPRFLHDYARQHWEYIVPELDRLGLVTVLDFGPLVMLCHAYGEWRTNIEFVMKTNGGILRTPSGYLAQIPHVSMARQAAACYRAISTEYGVTPSSRVGLADSRFALFDGGDDEGLDPWGGPA